MSLRDSHAIRRVVGTDAESGHVPAIIGTAANVNDVTETQALLHGNEKDAFGDAS